MNSLKKKRSPVDDAPHRQYRLNFATPLLNRECEKQRFCLTENGGRCGHLPCCPPEGGAVAPGERAGDQAQIRHADRRVRLGTSCPPVELASNGMESTVVDSITFENEFPSQKR